ncbi:MAG TPA: pyridoxamine 5'-phosphate oxidase [Gaiellaceae bacterium]|jgi:pyridoxamine 5'-phosphate oxidase|nr:pyridoxamine 5'-phosphate oxidase [Gaiellaceae bacterium]
MNNEYSSDPLEQLRAWLDTDVIALATASADGAPSVRMVLLKDVDEQGFLFFTSYTGRKGRELAENPRAAILVHMPGRQIRVEGQVEKTPGAVSDAYWATRPRGSQITASISSQSEPVESREELEARFTQFDTTHPGEIPRPAHWGGFRLIPETYEFWEHEENRLHDRIRYRRDGESWTVERLQP